MSDIQQYPVQEAAFVKILNPHDQPDALDELRLSWDDLARNAAEPNVFYESWMLIPAIRELAEKNNLQLWLIYAGARDETERRLIGLFPVEIGRRYARLPVRHAQPWLHKYAFLGTPLVRSGYEDTAVSALYAHLDTARPNVHFIHFALLDIRGKLAAALTASSSARHRARFTVKTFERALLQSTDTADAYLANSLRGKKRKELRRQARRLEDLGPVRYRILAEKVELEDWIADFLRLESAGWKGRSQSAMASMPADAAFFRSTILQAFEYNTLLFLRIDVGEAPVAMLVNFIGGHGAFSFKIAFDEQYAKYSPGVLIEIETMKQVLDRSKLEWMDSCAKPDHPMIDHLWRERRSLAYVNISRNRLSSRAILHFCRFLETTRQKLAERRKFKRSVA